MRIADLKFLQLVESPEGELLKVSTVYPGRNQVTASVVLPVPERTTVRWYDAEAVALWKEPSQRLLEEYDAKFARAGA